ncbi:MAG: hypothetical protein FJ096_10235 [Deltaproteobacteria bacterium]|nr:hypothetical protein [Deltaproteobacteria bacterium]
MRKAVRGHHLGWLGGILGIAACSGASAPEPEERASAVAQPVIQGTVDNGHPTVVAYVRNGGLCSATIVAVKGTKGYALTAGHCVGADLGEVIVGTNIGAPEKKYPVVKRAAHPGYGKTALYDVAMLEFSGVDGLVPVSPLLTPNLDSLKAGSKLEVVGYGKTEDGGSMTGVKHKKTMTVKQVTELRIVYDQKMGGICSGDSGGPSLTTAGTQAVAGVHSFVSGNNGSCLFEGSDMRVSAFVDTFIQPFIDGTPIGEQTCAQCTEAHTTNGQCSMAVGDCFATKDCPAYQSCIQACKKNGCIVECANQFPSGAALYDAIFGCVCDTGCPSACQDATFCNPPACGIAIAKESCAACMESSCCAEAQACSKSGICVDCLGSLIPGSACKTDPTTLAYDECLASSCASECNLPSSSSASSASSGGGEATTTTTSGGGAEPTSGSSSAATTGGAGGSDEETITEVSSCSAKRVGPSSAGTPGLVTLGLAAAALGLRSRRRSRSFAGDSRTRSG